MTLDFTPEYVKEISGIIIQFFIALELVSFVFKLMYFFITEKIKNKRKNEKK